MQKSPQPRKGLGALRFLVDGRFGLSAGFHTLASVVCLAIPIRPSAVGDSHQLQHTILCAFVLVSPIRSRACGVGTQCSHCGLKGDH